MSTSIKHRHPRLQQTLFALLSATDEDSIYHLARSAIAAGVKRREISSLLGITPSALSTVLHEN